jgi:signal transduction histidine kinase
MTATPQQIDARILAADKKPAIKSVKNRVVLSKLPRVPAHTHSSVRYGIAVLTVVIALIVTLQIELIASRTPFALFFAAVMTSTWLGGRKPGLLAIALSALVSDYFVIPPLHSMSPTREGTLQLGTFVLVALLINWLTAARQSSEASLRESEERLQTVIENLAEGLEIANLDGQLIHCNRAAVEMHGFATLEECLLRLPEFTRIFELSTLDGTVLKPEQWPLSRIIRGEHLRDLELCIRRIDSDWERIFSYGGTIVREPSGKQIAFVTISDVTESKRAAETLQLKNRELAAMTQQLWQASKLATVGELAASVAHELNNPLATVSLRLESLADQVAGDKEKSRAVEIVADEVERMGKLVGGLLEFSRRGHQQISTFDICDEIEKAIALIENYLRNRRIEVVQDFANGLPTVQADRQQLRQVFLNLLTNASDAMPHGGNLIVRVKSAGLESGRRGLSIEFIDAGAGISAADLEKIWEPFFTTKPEGKGTGLGLAICRRIIEEHHGTISIASRLGEGTTITILLPATNGEEQRLDRDK